MDLPLAIYPAVAVLGAGGLVAAVVFWPECKEKPVIEIEIPPAPAGCEEPQFWRRCYAIVYEEHLKIDGRVYAVTDDVIRYATNERYALMLPVMRILMGRGRD